MSGGGRVDSRARGADAAGVAAIVTLVLLLFVQVRHHTFVNFDDLTYIHENPIVRNGLDLSAVRLAFTQPHAAYWLPLTWISLAADRSLWGEWAGGFALTNVALHAIASALLYLFLARGTGRPLPSLFVALVFADHPLHVESVAWISQRKDTLAAVFLMLTLLAWQRYVERRDLRAYLAAGVLFGLGLLAKPTLVMVPLVLLLLDVWPFRRLQDPRGHRAGQFARLLAEKAPFFAAAAIAGAIVLRTQSSMGGREMADIVPLGVRLQVAGASFGSYLQQYAWPSGLAPLYPLLFDPPPAGRVAIGLALLLGVTAIAFRMRRRQPELLVGWLWFMLMLLPMSGLVHVGVQARADRWMYLPMIGLLIAVAWTIDSACARRPRLRLAAAAAGVLVVGALSLVTYRQIGYWRDTVTLFERAVAVTGDNYYAHDRLGQEYRARGDVARALPHYFEAIRLAPSLGRPQRHVAEMLARDGNAAAARVLADNAAAVRWGDSRADISTALALVRAGLDEPALALLQRVLPKRPESAELHSAMAVVQRRRGDIARAAAHWEQALRIEPRLYSSAGQLAWIWATSAAPSLRNPDGAIALAERALSDMRGLEPFLLDALAAAYAAVHRWEDAIDRAQRALEISRAAGNARLTADLEERLAAYRAHRSWIEPHPNNRSNR